MVGRGLAELVRRARGRGAGRHSAGPQPARARAPRRPPCCHRHREQVPEITRAGRLLVGVEADPTVATRRV